MGRRWIRALTRPPRAGTLSQRERGNSLLRTSSSPSRLLLIGRVSLLPLGEGARRADEGLENLGRKRLRLRSVQLKSISCPTSPFGLSVVEARSTPTLTTTVGDCGAHHKWWGTAFMTKEPAGHTSKRSAAIGDQRLSLVPCGFEAGPAGTTERVRVRGVWAKDPMGACSRLLRADRRTESRSAYRSLPYFSPVCSLLPLLSPSSPCPRRV